MAFTPPDGAVQYWQFLPLGPLSGTPPIALRAYQASWHWFQFEPSMPGNTTTAAQAAIDIGNWFASSFDFVGVTNAHGWPSRAFLWYGGTYTMFQWSPSWGAADHYEWPSAQSIKMVRLTTNPSYSARGGWYLSNFPKSWVLPSGVLSVFGQGNADFLAESLIQNVTTTGGFLRPVLCSLVNHTLLPIHRSYAASRCFIRRHRQLKTDYVHMPAFPTPRV